jgi:hypothetical protein
MHIDIHIYTHIYINKCIYIVLEYISNVYHPIIMYHNHHNNEDRHMHIYSLIYLYIL